MSSPRVGIWFIGARGGVAATATIGLIALQKQLSAPLGLVTAQPPFSQLDLIDWSNFVVGGHDIRDSTLSESINRLRNDSRVLDAALVDACQDEIAAIDRRIRPGTLTNCGTTIASLAGTKTRDFDQEPARETIGRLQNDLKAFQQKSGLTGVVVVNVASTEPINDSLKLPERWADLERDLGSAAASSLPASSLYAIAAIELGIPFVNFTPSLGAFPAAIQQLAIERKTCIAGQ